MRDVLWRELDDAKARLLDVRRIRITPDALIGSPMTVPLTPERLRTLDADVWTGHAWRELVIHPTDWLDFIIDADLIRDVDVMSDPVCVLGVPVTR